MPSTLQGEGFEKRAERGEVGFSCQAVDLMADACKSDGGQIVDRLLELQGVGIGQHSTPIDVGLKKSDGHIDLGGDLLPVIATKPGALQDGS